MTPVAAAVGAASRLRLPGGTGIPELAALLAPLGRLCAAAPRLRRSTLLDTFDGRLHRAGLFLEQSPAGSASRLTLRPLGGGRALGALRGRAPRFARELPRCTLRERLLPLVETRALLPLATRELETVRLALRTGAVGRETRLRLELARAGAPGEEPRRDVAPVLHLPAGAPGRRIADVLAAVPGVAPAADPVTETLAPLGRAAREGSGKPALELAPEMPARDASRALLLALLGTIERNLPGARDDLDPEFLHDLRVAVRRSRSLLGQAKGVFPAASTARFAAGLAWLQEVTGPARDLDVFVLDLPALRALLPAASRRGLAPLARLLARRRAAAHRDLAVALASPRLARLLGQWRAFLERPAPLRPRRTPRALLPVREVAARRIRKLYRRALDEGRAVTDRSPAADLHELRKTCKKLRYLLELFASLFEREAVRTAVEVLRGLQDDLGRHQDLQVQAGELLRYARELAAEGRAGPAAYLAIGMLVERLREEQAAARRAFAARFHPFAARGNRRRMRRLAGRGRPTEAPAAPLPRRRAAG